MTDLRSQIIEAMARAMDKDLRHPCKEHGCLYGPVSPDLNVIIKGHVWLHALAEAAFAAIGELAAVVPRQTDEKLAFRLLRDMQDLGVGGPAPDWSNRVVATCDSFIASADQSAPVQAEGEW